MNIQKLKLCIVPIPFNKITPLSTKHIDSRHFSEVVLYLSTIIQHFPSRSIIYYKKTLIFKISAFLFNFILRMYHTTTHKTFPSLQIEGNVLSFQKL